MSEYSFQDIIKGSFVYLTFKVFLPLIKWVDNNFPETEDRPKRIDYAKINLCYSIARAHQEREAEGRIKQLVDLI